MLSATYVAKNKYFENQIQLFSLIQQQRNVSSVIHTRTPQNKKKKSDKKASFSFGKLKTSTNSVTLYCLPYCLLCI